MTEFSQVDPEFQHHFMSIEPDFDFLASYGEIVLPILENFWAGEDELLALRAIYVAGLLHQSTGLSLLQKAASDSRATVRVAVAGALRLLVERSNPDEDDARRKLQTQEVLGLLLVDTDPSVRRWAAKTAGMVGVESLKESLQQLESEDIEASVRAAASEALKKLDKDP